MLKKKIIKNIMIIVSVISILLIVVTIIVEKINKERTIKIDLGNSIYEEMHNLYSYGGNLNYLTDNTNLRIVTTIENTKYYEITNYDEIKEILSSSFESNVLNFLNIKTFNNKYYVSTIGKGLSNYYGTTLKIKKIGKNKIEYKAITKMCKVDKVVSYGEGCMADGYYEIEKPFIIVKEDNKWKVLEYTSIFQFSDRELK